MELEAVWDFYINTQSFHFFLLLICFFLCVRYFVKDMHSDKAFFNFPGGGEGGVYHCFTELYYTKTLNTHGLVGEGGR